MRDEWYGDKRDLIKWGVLLRLADQFAATRIVQLAFYRPSQFGTLLIDGKECPIPDQVLTHFRNIRNIGSIGSRVRVTVFDPPFKDRAAHEKAVLALLPAFAGERCVIFLDPDTGLAPKNPSLAHVLESEARSIWNAMKAKDIFALYQHRTNMAGRPWIEDKRDQLARALNISSRLLKSADARKIADDVVFFYTQRA